MNYIQEYIDKINSGEIVACQKIKKLYNNIIQPILNGESKEYYLNEKKGERAVRFMETFCKQSLDPWAGQPLKLVLFQKAKLQAIFGILHRETDLRRFREVFDVRGRKNGKSTELSGTSLYLLVGDKERGAEIYCAATVASQSRRVWDEADSMRDQSSDLAKVVKRKVFPTPILYCPKTGSKFRPLSKNVKTFDGLNASCAVIDEAHELSRKIYDILKQSMSTRRQPLMNIITTSGFVRGGLFDDLYKYASKIINGQVIDDEVFPLIYELDDPSEIDKEECWVKANPGLDVIKSRDALRGYVKRMKSDANFANTVKTKDFNLIGVDNQAWLTYEEFNVEDEYSEEELKRFDNTVVLGGYDLSRTGDMTAFTTLLFDKVKHRPIAITMYWITQRFLDSEDASSSKVPWHSWVDRGLVRISGKETINYHDVVVYVLENFRKHGWIYQHMNYDSYSAQYLVEEFASYGYVDGYCQIPTPQGAKTLSVPMQTVEAHLKEKKICYQNNDVTKWCLSNVELETDRNGNYMMKKNSGDRRRKIDGVATIVDCYVSLCENMDYYLS